MPLYEYECSKCGKVFETIQKFADAPLTVHEGCGGHVERLLSAPAFHLKGSGWYATDYAKGASGGAVKPESSGKSEQSSDSKSDSKSSDSKSSDSKASESKTDSHSSKPEKSSDSRPAASAPKND